MNPYFFIITNHNHRTGEPIGKTCGVVFAENSDSAEAQAWALAGNNTASGLTVEQVPPEGYRFTVYKSSI